MTGTTLHMRGRRNKPTANSQCKARVAARTRPTLRARSSSSTRCTPTIPPVLCAFLVHPWASTLTQTYDDIEGMGMTNACCFMLRVFCCRSKFSMLHEFSLPWHIQCTQRRDCRQHTVITFFSLPSHLREVLGLGSRVLCCPAHAQLGLDRAPIRLQGHAAKQPSQPFSTRPHPKRRFSQ